MTFEEKEQIRRKQLLAHTDTIHTHSRRCKSKLDDCKVCQLGIKWFDGLGLQDLSFVLSERRTK